MFGKITTKKLQKLLKEEIKVLRLSSVDSTNRLAKEMVLFGEKMPFWL